MVLAFAGGSRRRLARAFNVVMILTVGLFVATKSAPKIFSRTKLARSAAGISFISTPTEQLHLQRADLYFPIHLRSDRVYVAAIRDLIQYLRDTTRPGEPIFAFPALPMVYFLSGRDNPTRHDYFLSNNVGADEQLEVIRSSNAATCQRS